MPRAIKWICHVVPQLFLTVLLLFTLSSFAQGPKPRLNGTITETARTVLVGSRTLRAQRGQDMGAVSPETIIPGITLVFKRSAEQEEALQELLAAQQNVTSPLYHQWLTPDTFAARFGVADEDIAATERWLQSRGFHVENEVRSQDRITFSGTAAQVQAAFGAGLHYYRTEGELHFAPEADLTLPTELASVTAAVLHLSNFRPQPNAKVRIHPRPDYTSLSTQAHYLTPKDIFTMYDANSVLKGGDFGPPQRLAVVGQSYVDTSASSEIWQFQANLTGANTISTVLVPGSGVEAISPGDEGESQIDLEYASGIAQSAGIFFVYVGDNQNYDVFDALAFAITQDIAPVVSISYGVCESAMSTTELDQGNALFEQAAAQGQTLVAAAGDNGSTACASYTSSEGISSAQQQALAVEYPADSPYVTAVGGTQMAAGTFAAGSSPYWASASNYDTVSSLVSYVPEVVWNEDSAFNSIAAGGGGASAHFPRPTWQNGAPAIPSGSYRLLPDIALQSSIESPGFIVCSSDPALINSQGQISSCTDGTVGSNNKYTTAGGTSFAAPVFAGFIAILNQIEQTNGQGNVNPILYQLASNPTSYASVFHDITSGTNACAAGVSNCAAPGESGYVATPGYDEATGLGSIDFGHLVTAWPSGNTVNLTRTSTLLVPSEYSAASGASVPIQINVQSWDAPYGTPVPTGTVSVSVDGTVVQPSLAFSTTDAYYSKATANYNFVAPATAGSHLVTVTYLGDATHSGSVATFPILVGNVVASGGFQLSAGNLTIANGATGSTQITVTPTGGYNGRIVWSLSISNGTGGPALCYGIGSAAVSGTSTTTLTIGSGSACNSPLPAERRNFQPMTARVSLDGESSSPRRSTPRIAIFAGLLLCVSIAGRRRCARLPQLLVAITLLAVAGIGLNGCGGGNSSGGNGTGTSTTPPVSPSSYTVTLKGTDSVNTSITASTSFTLTVD